MWISIVGISLVLAVSTRAQPTVIFETRFETVEGYSADKDLSGQNGWIHFGSGGNGILIDPLKDFTGQVAYIGFSSPASTNDTLNVWRPINLIPAGKSQPIVRFTVGFQIQDSTTNAPNFDDFRWSVYNTEGRRLFTLDFDNDSRRIHYVLDDDLGFQNTGYAFNNSERYDLAISLNFTRNIWSADINGAVVVNAAPITTKRSKLDLGDIDAVWSIRTIGKPGDNYMIFDDFKITAEDANSIPATVQARGILNGKTFLLRVLGEPGIIYSIQTSKDFFSWTEIGRQTASTPSGFAEFQDPVAIQNGTRFYRAMSVPQ